MTPDAAPQRENAGAAGQSRPIALTIAGSDSSGGAGIQADLKTFSALGVYGASVLTALTAQNTTGVQAVEMLPAAFVAQQMESVFSDLDVGAIKTGMLGTAETIEVVAARLAKARTAGIPSVVDPVMVATSGDMLITAKAVAALKAQLMTEATVVTPNMDEAAALLDTSRATTRDDLVAQGRALCGLGCRAVLMKGGHFEGPRADDVFVTADRVVVIEGERIETSNTHGTGCTLAAAIASYLAAGCAPEEAVRRGKQYLTAALRHGAQLQIGHGIGPVDHLFAIAPPENTR